MRPFLQAIDRISHYNELTKDITAWKKIIALTPAEKARSKGGLKMGLTDFRLNVWEKGVARGGMFGAYLQHDRSVLPYITTGEERRWRPVWKNDKYLPPCAYACPSRIPSHKRATLLVAAGGGASTRIARAGFDAHFGADPDRVFLVDQVEETQLVLKSVELDGRDERTHVKGANATEFRISPDGRWLAFTEKQKAWVAPFALTGKTVEIGPESKAVPVRQVSRRAGENLHWSADAAKLHWSLGSTLFTRELKDAFAFLAGAPPELPEPVEQGIDLRFRVAADAPRGAIALVGARGRSSR